MNSPSLSSSSSLHSFLKSIVNYDSSMSRFELFNIGSSLGGVLLQRVFSCYENQLSSDPLNSGSGLRNLSNTNSDAGRAETSDMFSVDKMINNNVELEIISIIYVLLYLGSTLAFQQDDIELNPFLLPILSWLEFDHDLHVKNNHFNQHSKTILSQAKKLTSYLFENYSSSLINSIGKMSISEALLSIPKTASSNEKEFAKIGKYNSIKELQNSYMKKAPMMQNLLHYSSSPLVGAMKIHSDDATGNKLQQENVDVDNQGWITPSPFMFDSPNTDSFDLMWMIPVIHPGIIIDESIIKSSKTEEEIEVDMKLNNEESKYDAAKKEFGDFITKFITEKKSKKESKDPNKASATDNDDAYLKFRNSLEEFPQLAFECGLTTDNITSLITYDQFLSVDLLSAMARLPNEQSKVNSYHSTIVHMERSLESMEVVNRLATKIKLPPMFLELYISGCIHDCKSEKNDKGERNRLIRLVAVFLNTLVRSNTIDAISMDFELKSFCAEHSDVKEVVALLRLLNSKDSSKQTQS